MPATLDSVTSSRCPPEPTTSSSGGARPARRSVAGVGDESLVDGVADVSLQRAERFFAGLAFGLLAEVVGAPGGVVADLGDGGHVDRVVQLAVTAGFNRCRFLGPDEASIGAVPLWRAKCPAVGKRRMSPTRPMMIAAVDGPIPWIAVTVVPHGRPRPRCVGGPRCGRRRGRGLVEQLARGGDPLGGDGAVDVHAGQKFFGFRRRSTTGRCRPR